MSEMMRRWWRKMAYVTDLRWRWGDGAAEKKILMWAVLLRMTVFEGLTVFRLFARRGCMVKEGWCHVGVDG
jgi:hypothetical protein